MYLPRLLDVTVAGLLADLPAVMLTGPRATGKTTTAARLATTQLRLDQPEQAAVVSADPDASLRGHRSPVLVDEWQVVPSILGAIKRAVDDDSSPGRFVITGSVRADLEAATWPGTGRLVRIPMFGLTTRERLGRATGPGLIDRITMAPEDTLVDAVGQPPDAPDLRGYVTELLVGGFPQPALNLGPERREVWHESYLEQVVTRDAEMVEPGRDPVRIRRYVEVLALNSTGVLADSDLHRAAGLDRRTGVAYQRLLGGLGLLDPLPPWWTNRLKRLVRRPKLTLTDAALAAAAIRADETEVMSDGNLLGRLLETFAICQLRAELASSRSRARLHHLRTEQGRHEVDLILELSRRRVIGIEVKATSAPGRGDARHLTWLRDELGPEFVAGLVLHTGSRTFKIDSNIIAAPIAAIWN